MQELRPAVRLQSTCVPSLWRLLATPRSCWVLRKTETVESCRKRRAGSPGSFRPRGRPRLRWGPEARQGARRGAVPGGVHWRGRCTPGPGEEAAFCAEGHGELSVCWAGMGFVECALPKLQLGRQLRRNSRLFGHFVINHQTEDLPEDNLTSGSIRLNHCPPLFLGGGGLFQHI